MKREEPLRFFRIRVSTQSPEIEEKKEECPFLWLKCTVTPNLNELDHHSRWIGHFYQTPDECIHFRGYRHGSPKEVTSSFPTSSNVTRLFVGDREPRTSSIMLKERDMPYTNEGVIVKYEVAVHQFLHEVVAVSHILCYVHNEETFIKKLVDNTIQWTFRDRFLIPLAVRSIGETKRYTCTSPPLDSYKEVWDYMQRQLEPKSRELLYYPNLVPSLNCNVHPIVLNALNHFERANREQPLIRSHLRGTCVQLEPRIYFFHLVTQFLHIVDDRHNHPDLIIVPHMYYPYLFVQFEKTIFLHRYIFIMNRSEYQIALRNLRNVIYIIPDTIVDLVQTTISYPECCFSQIPTWRYVFAYNCKISHMHYEFLWNFVTSRSHCNDALLSATPYVDCKDAFIMKTFLDPCINREGFDFNTTWRRTYPLHTVILFPKIDIHLTSSVPLLIGHNTSDKSNTLNADVEEVFQKKYDSFRAYSNQKVVMDLKFIRGTFDDISGHLSHIDFISDAHRNFFIKSASYLSMCEWDEKDEQRPFCPICRNPLSDTRLPLLFFCGHYLCGQCFIQIVRHVPHSKNQLLCPECRSVCAFWHSNHLSLLGYESILDGDTSKTKTMMIVEYLRACKTRVVIIAENSTDMNVIFNTYRMLEDTQRSLRFFKLFQGQTTYLCRTLLAFVQSSDGILFVPYSTEDSVNIRFPEEIRLFVFVNGSQLYDNWCASIRARCSIVWSLPVKNKEVHVFLSDDEKKADYQSPFFIDSPLRV